MLYCTVLQVGEAFERNINDNVTDAVTWATEKPKHEVD